MNESLSVHFKRVLDLAKTELNYQKDCNKDKAIVADMESSVTAVEEYVKNTFIEPHDGIFQECFRPSEEMIALVRKEKNLDGTLVARFIDNDKAYRHRKFWEALGFKGRCKTLRPGCHAVYITVR